MMLVRGRGGFESWQFHSVRKLDVWFTWLTLWFVKGRAPT